MELAFAFFIIVGAIIMFFIGQSNGHKKGRKLGHQEGREEGIRAEQALWMKRAQDAALAGTPWVGVDLPAEPESEPEEE